MFCVAKRPSWILAALLILSVLVLARPEAADLQGPDGPVGYLDISVKPEDSDAEGDDWRDKAWQAAQLAVGSAARLRKAAEAAVKAIARGELADETAAAAIAAGIALAANETMNKALEKPDTPEPVLKAAEDAVKKAKEAVEKAEKANDIAKKANDIAKLAAEKEEPAEALRTLRVLSRQAAMASFDAEVAVNNTIEAIRAAKASDTKPTDPKPINIYIDGKLLEGKQPFMGRPVAAGKKTVRAELKESGWITKAAIKSVEVGADVVHKVELELKWRMGKLIIINEAQKDVKLDGKKLEKLETDVPVGPHKIQVEVTKEKTADEPIEVCKDYVLKVWISKDLKIESLNKLPSCKGIWPIATHKSCPTGGPDNLHYFQECALGVPWGTRRQDIQDTFGLPQQRGRWLAYEHPEKEYRIAYHIGPRGLDRVEVTGTGAPMVSDLISGVATYGELMKELGSTTGVTKLKIRRQENGCAKGVQFGLKGLSFSVVCHPEQPPRDPYDRDSDGNLKCTSPLLCKNWRVTKQ